MSRLLWVMAVTQGENTRRAEEIFRQSASLFWQHLAQGTASNEILDYLGLGRAENKVFLAVCPTEAARTLLARLVEEIKLDVPGHGIAFTVPLSSVAGRKTIELLTLGNSYEPEEEQELKGTEHEVIFAIAKEESTDLVMDAARSAGAGGGTVIHAKGTQSKEAEKFLGMTLAEERALVMILTQTEKKDAIMQAIVHQTGMNTKTQAIVFSLPVTRVVGLREHMEIGEV